MKRRTYVLGLGSVVAGSATALGTGAFSSVAAGRTASIEVADDANAFLALERDTNVRPADIADDPLFSDDGGRLVFHFDGDDSAVDGAAAAEGLNDEAVTYFELLRITNEGTNDVSVSISLRDGDGTDRSDEAGFRAYAYGFGGRNRIANADGSWDLGLGVGFEFDLIAGDPSVYDRIETIRIEATTL